MAPPALGQLVRSADVSFKGGFEEMSHVMHMMNCRVVGLRVRATIALGNAVRDSNRTTVQWFGTAWFGMAKRYGKRAQNMDLNND
jgi:hypothetical protein